MSARLGPMADPGVIAVIDRILAESRPAWEARRLDSVDPRAFAEYALPVTAEQGQLMYLLCRATRARRVAECATSLGVSTLYLAAAVRDNGGGIVIGSEIVASKARRARENLLQAGLDRFAQVRSGDAREALADLGGPVDFMLLDGWSSLRPPSLARSVIELVRDQLRDGAIVVNDNGEPDYLDYVRDPANGFLSMSLPLKGDTELSVRLAQPPSPATQTPAATGAL